jgi:aryl-alcohol dehydrogenase-like predicted oxidoreductase
MAAMKQYPLDFIQVDYSIENRNAAESVLAFAQERKVGVLINVPFGGRGRGAAGTFAKVKGRELPDFAKVRRHQLGSGLPEVHRLPSRRDRHDSGDDAAPEP